MLHQTATNSKILRRGKGCATSCPPLQHLPLHARNEHYEAKNTASSCDLKTQGTRSKGPTHPTKTREDPRSEKILSSTSLEEKQHDIRAGATENTTPPFCKGCLRRWATISMPGTAAFRTVQ